MSDIADEALKRHKQLAGKIAIALKDPDFSFDKLKLDYTPGVAAVSSYVAAHPKEARDYTWLNNSVAVVSDGSAVLGLGNIGPLGALPVMEGKAMLFKQFGGIDAVPIVLDVHTADDIVAAVKAIAPSFGGINLEDIAAPVCFEVEERLKAELHIPVMHDDQHGTAIVVLAGLINALKVKQYILEEWKIVIAGAGAAGVAIANLLWKYGARHIVVADSKGIIGPKRTDLNGAKKSLLQYNITDYDGSLEDALRGAHVFIGVSGPGTISGDMIRTMAREPIIFALSNPSPEIMPDDAKAAGALIVATGRSDFPNQVNNALVFPGIFRGALDNKVRKITDEHKIKAAEVLAGFVKVPSVKEIIPRITTGGLVSAIADIIC
jgi:malate dehydrogenase (oxaloacetate-decarboxylating)